MTPRKLRVWTKCRTIYWLLEAFGPQDRPWLRRMLGMGPKGDIETILRSCETHGFLLAEDGNLLSAWKITAGKYQKW